MILNKLLKVFKKSEIKPISKCPYNKNIECVAGVFCDGCSHEFDDMRRK